MHRVQIVLFSLLVLLACQEQPQKEVHVKTPEVSFLTRKGCPKSPAVYKSLLAVLAVRGLSEEPTTIFLGELEVNDIRTGYGTPTILVDGKDLFGRSKPAPATPM
ncbi:MAG: hypothetical protein ACI9HY_000730 [Planctomycetaceae bacterium]|jgi:hypothetical protein